MLERLTFDPAQHYNFIYVDAFPFKFHTCQLSPPDCDNNIIKTGVSKIGHLNKIHGLSWARYQRC